VIEDRLTMCASFMSSVYIFDLVGLIFLVVAAHCANLVNLTNK